MTNHFLHVGTIGEGVFRSLDHGATFRRACEGMFVECDVRALAVHPDSSETLYLGSELGLFVSHDSAGTWTQLPAPLGGLEVWSLALLPGQPEVILAGTRPARVYRSDDAGRTWAEAHAAMMPDCPRIVHTRVTCLLPDPARPERVLAGVEIDGLYASDDGGLSWGPIGRGLSSRDIHALARCDGRLYAATNNDLNVSLDDGITWQPCEIGKSMPWSYCRALGQKVGSPEVLLLGNGDFPPGSVGAIGLSRDGGRTWAPAKMPGRSNSTMWCFATHPADAELIYAASVSGEVYRSTDGGVAWEKLEREFGEIRALAWAPAP